MRILLLIGFDELALCGGLACLIDDAIMLLPAPVVQWTEQGTPKALMWVRFPPGAL